MNKIFAVSGVVVRELYRRKDFYVLFILTVLITLLAGSANFFNDKSIVRYLKEICLVLIWISALVVAISTAARQIPFERESRTIFPLLAKPISRAQVLMGKFLGCWLASGGALLVFYIFFALVSVSHEHSFPLGNYLQAFWMHWQMVGIVVAVTLLGSVVLSTVAANVTILFIVTLGILFVGPHLHKVAAGMTEPSGSILTAIYFVIPHLEFFDLRSRIVHDWPLVEWAYIGGATLYAWLYTAFFLMAACLAFRRKALN
ncbi:MAG: ABC transporter permease subunit [Akkermansiaceae bacterium]|nr:ABC transporter permease subunit [Verrucomicrobiales bacterium]